MNNFSTTIPYYLFIGPALMLLNQEEDAALEHFVENFRKPLWPKCNSKCNVFVSSNLSKKTAMGQKCCTKMSYSCVSNLVTRAGAKAGFHGRLGSRIIRRSAITSMWHKNAGNVPFKSALANLAGHTLDTAERYYDYSSKTQGGLTV